MESNGGDRGHGENGQLRSETLSRPPEPIYLCMLYCRWQRQLGFLDSIFTTTALELRLSRLRTSMASMFLCAKGNLIALRQNLYVALVFIRRASAGFYPVNKTPQAWKKISFSIIDYRGGEEEEDERGEHTELLLIAFYSAGSGVQYVKNSIIFNKRILFYY